MRLHFFAKSNRILDNSKIADVHCCRCIGQAASDHRGTLRMQQKTDWQSQRLLPKTKFDVGGDIKIYKRLRDTRLIVTRGETVFAKMLLHAIFIV